MIERLRRSNTSGVARKEADTQVLVADLENKMVQLYSKILEYQIRLMRQSSHNWALRYGRDVFKFDEWKMMLSQIKGLDSTCSQLAEELGQEELEAGLKENNVKIDILLHSWNVGLQDLQEQGMNTLMAVDAHAREDRSWREREEFRRLLQALRAKNPYRDQMERTATRQPGTCNWFLKHPRFQTWREDAYSKLLWVSANPGCGKSVLSKCFVEEKLATLDPRQATICYFFFKDVSPDSRSITKALSAILHQLFTRLPCLVEHALSAFDENGDEISSMFSTMWEILENAAADLRAGEIVCVLDALDECEEASQITLIEKLKTFYSRAEESNVPKKKLRFLLTSRPYRNIRTQFHGLIRQFPTIHLSGDDESDLIKEEIDLVIQSKVSEIASERCFDRETEQYLLKQLLNIENRTYLWLHLILDHIRNSDNAGNKKAIRKEIQAIPQSVSKAYEAILAKTKDKPLATNLLHIIVGAETALTLKELNVAMSIEEDCRSYKDLELESAGAFEIRVKSICGLFIYTDRSKVFLIHQTAKEFLSWYQDASETPTGMWQHSLRPEDSNSLLAGICMSLLMFDDFETDPLSAEGLDHPVSDVQIEQYCDSHVLLKYASQWWTEHLKSSPPERQIGLLHDTARLCKVSSRRCWTWLRMKRFAEDSYQPSGFTDLILACDVGLVELVKHVLSKEVDVNARDKEGATALNRAVGEGSVDVVRTLLDNGADIEAGDWDTPWRVEIDQNGVEREVKQYSARPLTLATINEDHEMMRELLTAGANPDARPNVDLPFRSSALHYATLFSDEQTMRILLDHGADVNAKVGVDHSMARQGLIEVGYPMRGPVTALGIAVGLDDAAKVGLLLSFGADPGAEIHVKDEDDEIQPFLRPGDSEKSVSDSVCENDGQDTSEGSIPAKDIEHISAAGSGRAGSFEEDDGSKSELISANEANRLNPTSREYGAQEVDSYPAIAIYCGEVYTGPIFDGKIPPELIVKELERTTKAVSKITVFHYAAIRGVEDVVRLLSRHMAPKKPASLAPAEPTALHLAALLGSGQVVKMILDQTVNVNPKDLEERTPLHLAVWCGYDRVVNELLEHGADPNAKDYNGATPLHIAILTNYDLVVEDLLDYGADIHIEHNNGVSPQRLAKRKGIDQRIKRLLIISS